MIRAAVLVFAVLAVPATAQGLKNHDSKAPVDFEADRIEVQDRADRAVLSGNVRVKQAGLTLDAARLTVAYTGAVVGGNPSVQRLDASGGVFVRSGNDSARGSFATYDLNRRLSTMIGDVTLNQGSNVLRGGRLVIDLASGRSVIDGRSSGVTGGGRGRVSGRFSVPQRASDATP